MTKMKTYNINDFSHFCPMVIDYDENKIGKSLGYPFGECKWHPIIMQDGNKKLVAISIFSK